MGKRKERRLAAKSNAGRRVKLDLFAEPSSGDLGGSSVPDEVGVRNEPKNRAVLPNSPSTSGQPENPLLLLGQYSDDDLEVESDKKPAAETSSPGNKHEAEVLKGEACPDADVIGSEIKQLESVTGTEDASTKNDEAIGSSEASKDIILGQVSTSKASEVNGDVSSNWQIVMHEESSRYYYWNVATSETSWEVPEALARESNLPANHKALVTSETMKSGLPEVLDPTPSSGGTETVEGLNPLELNEVKNEAIDSSLVAVSLDVDFIKVDDSGLELPSSLIKHAESLLERLKSVTGSNSILKYTLEVETRLSDIKTLSNFGSSLNHFWAHSQTQLKRLEDSINLEIYNLVQLTIIEQPKPNGMVNMNDSTLMIDTSADVAHDSSLGEQSNGNLGPDDLNPEQESHSSPEDFDMDVDMEVEDQPPNDTTREFIGPPDENHDQIPPPPPEEEWVPPPPPDSDKNSPPPQPVAPPEPICMQYDSSYPNSNFGYYSKSDAINSENFYGQVQIPQAPIYYSAIPGTYPEISQVAYYDFEDNLVPPVPGLNSSVESSQLTVQPTQVMTYGNVASDTVVSSGPTPVITYGSVAMDSAVKMSHSLLGIVNETVKVPPISSVEEIVSIPSTNVVSSTSEVNNAQTKVARSKKRALAVAVGPISRSNKKVSSLVNKWKAAKEELLEDEEESLDAYEILEKKRQKEIEEWHAQQIASREAKDNPNFQPLGGDWRERVKRRRAKQAGKAAKTESPVETKEENQKPDLSKLEKDLPSGWQVYWDESLKKVYYGNVVTSETTWTRPTK